METVRLCIRYFVRNEKGATAIEYGLLAALIAVVIAVAAAAVGNNLVNVFNYVKNKLVTPGT